MKKEAVTGVTLFITELFVTDLDLLQGLVSRAKCISTASELYGVCMTDLFALRGCLILKEPSHPGVQT
jgi:hypothetical protein